MKLSRFIKVSRPRFWLYLGGPYLVGYTYAAATSHDFYSFHFWYPLFFFFIPANFFLYGINDLFDQDTDELNPKKDEKEARLEKHSSKKYWKLVLFSFACTIPLFFIFNSLANTLLFAFLALSFFYSAVPFRFKSKPILDFSSNILYALPGFIAYAQLSNHLPTWQVYIPAFCWTAGMHLFSAIPDIPYDRKAGIHTTATMLGRRASLLVCTFFWIIAAFGALWVTTLFIPALIYPLLAFILIFRHYSAVSKVYWWFPFINAFNGFVLFFYALFHLL